MLTADFYLNNCFPWFKVFVRFQENITNLGMIMLPLRAMMYLTKPLILCLRNSLEFLVRGSQDTSKTIQAIGITFDGLLEFEDKALLLKTWCSLDAGLAVLELIPDKWLSVSEGTEKAKRLVVLSNCKAQKPQPWLDWQHFHWWTSGTVISTVTEGLMISKPQRSWEAPDRKVNKLITSSQLWSWKLPTRRSAYQPALASTSPSCRETDVRMESSTAKVPLLPYKTLPASSTPMERAFTVLVSDNQLLLTVGLFLVLSCHLLLSPSNIWCWNPRWV